MTDRTRTRTRKSAPESDALEMWTSGELSALAAEVEGPTLSEVIEDLKMRGLLRCKNRRAT